MKRSLIALALFASAALSGAASASSYNSQTGLQMTSNMFAAGIGGGSSDMSGGGSSCQKFSVARDHGGGTAGITKMDVAKLPTPWSKQEELFAKQGEGLGGKVPKTGQFTVGGQYVAGAHLSPTWEGDLHL